MEGIYPALPMDVRLLKVKLEKVRNLCSHQNGVHIFCPLLASWSIFSLFAVCLGMALHIGNMLNKEGKVSGGDRQEQDVGWGNQLDTVFNDRACLSSDITLKQKEVKEAAPQKPRAERAGQSDTEMDRPWLMVGKAAIEQSSLVHPVWDRCRGKTLGMQGGGKLFSEDDVLSQASTEGWVEVRKKDHAVVF